MTPSQLLVQAAVILDDKIKYSSDTDIAEALVLIAIAEFKIENAHPNAIQLAHDLIVAVIEKRKANKPPTDA